MRAVLINRGSILRFLVRMETPLLTVPYNRNTTRIRQMKDTVRTAKQQKPNAYANMKTKINQE